uniref:DUF834 domain-containing protein n=1 Tax=Oryza glaberrima TaxID=4538 RepID=I1R3U0_ORYGL
RLGRRRRSAGGRVIGPTGGGRVEKEASPPPPSPCALTAGLPTPLSGRPARGWEGKVEEVTVGPKGGDGIGVPQPGRRRRLQLHLLDRRDEDAAMQIWQLSDVCRSPPWEEAGGGPNANERSGGRWRGGGRHRATAPGLVEEEAIMVLDDEVSKGGREASLHGGGLAREGG